MPKAIIVSLNILIDNSHLIDKRVGHLNDLAGTGLI